MNIAIFRSVTRTTLAGLLSLTLQTAGTSVYAQTTVEPPIDLRYEALQTGKTEQEIRRIFDVEPSHVRRSVTGGFEHATVVYETQGNRYQLTFWAGRLVKKSVEPLGNKSTGWRGLFGQ